MKKVLFATTALVATASVAAADVRLSGYGRFGLDYNSGNTVPLNTATAATTVGATAPAKTNLTSRLRIQFDVSTETDGGVGFNARVRMQGENRDGVAGTMGLNAPRFGVSYGGLLVNVGNIIGAVENTPGLYTTGTRSAGTGIDGMGYNSLVIQGAAWDAYSSTGTGVGNGVEALYTAGGFTGHISYSNRNTNYCDDGTALGDQMACGTTASFTGKGEDRVGIMGTYSWSDYYVSASYQSSSNGPVADNGAELNDGLYMLAAGGDWGMWGARIAYGKTEAAKTWLLEGNVDIGAAQNLLLWVNGVDANTSTMVAGSVVATDGTNYGINYQYDLGGGTTFVAGYVRDAAKTNQFQAGVYFSF